MIIIYGIYQESGDGCTYSSEGFIADKFYIKKENAEKERDRLLLNEYSNWEDNNSSLTVKEIEVKL